MEDVIKTRCPHPGAMTPAEALGIRDLAREASQRDLEAKRAAEASVARLRDEVGQLEDMQRTDAAYIRKLRAALESLPLKAFEDMDDIDAADFVDHANDFLQAMMAARAALDSSEETPVVRVCADGGMNQAITAAAKHIYAKYGPDLAAFFRDVDKARCRPQRGGR